MTDTSSLFTSQLGKLDFFDCNSAPRTVGIFSIGSYFGHPGWIEFFVFISLYFACGLSITVGYHRLFSHRSHTAKWPLVLFYSIFGAGASFQNSIIEWSSDHRRHHKETDSEDDPYSASKGFWYSHMGWILVEEEKFTNDFSNVKDLQKVKLSCGNTEMCS